MNHRLTHPFAAIESRAQAIGLSRWTVFGFALWAAVLLLQGLLVWNGQGTEPVQYRDGTTGLAVFMALIAAAAAGFQWRKPNRVLAAFGLGWSLYELSSLSVGLLVGHPMAMGGLPAWVGAVTAGALVVCAIMHIGGLRGTSALMRDNI